MAENKRPQSIQNCFNASKTLSSLLEQADILQAIDASVQEFVKNHHLTNVSAANFRNNRLVLGCRSAAWQHRLKPLIPALLQHLRQNGYPQILGIETKILL